MKKYQAEINGNTFTMVFEGDNVRINGVLHSYSFEPLGNGLYSLLLDHESFPVFVASAVAQEGIRVSVQGQTSTVVVKDEKDLLLEKFGVSLAKKDAASEVHAPMPGLVLHISVTDGQAVKLGERLLTLEAMKMENEIKSPKNGTIKSIHVAQGDAVAKNTLLVSFES